VVEDELDSDGSSLTGAVGRVGVGATIFSGGTTVVGGRLGIGAVSGTSTWLEVVREMGSRESSCKAALLDVVEGLDKRISAGGSCGEVSSAESGSGRHSRLDLLHRGQTHSRERAASRFRSTVGYSRAPMPTAAVPFRGRKP